MKKIFLIVMISICSLISNSQTCDTTLKTFTNVTNPASNATNKCKARYVTHRNNYPTIGKQTWYYEIYSGTPNVSHALFAFPQCVKIINFGNYTTFDSSTFNKKTLDSYKASNPPTGLPGYKYDVSLSTGLYKFYITVYQIYYAGTIGITIKGANSYETKTFCGPISDCSVLPLHLISKNIEKTDGFDIVKFYIVNDFDISYYNIELMTLNDKILLDSNIKSMMNNYELKYKSREGNYLYRITSFNFLNESTDSFDLYVSNVNKLLNVFPNPANNYINIPNKIGSKLSIYDMEGKVVFETTITSDNIYFNINPGLYLLYCGDKYTKLNIF